MNEATSQAFAVQSMKFACSELNKKMMMYVASSNEQNPVDGNRRPGALLDDAHLVGIEFKICEGDRFPSWHKGQHETYVGLTAGSPMALPLYYAYNVINGMENGRLGTYRARTNARKPLDSRIFVRIPRHNLAESIAW